VSTYCGRFEGKVAPVTGTSRVDVTLASRPGLAGTDLGHSAWIDIYQPRIDAFAEATEDRQWIHVDQYRAADGPFGTTIAHGYLTLSLVSKFLLDLLVVRDADSVINYGLDRVRFPAPVPVGARVRGHGVLVEAIERGTTTQVKTRITVECSTGEKPAAIADVLTLFRK